MKISPEKQDLMESVQQKKAPTGTNIRAHYFQSYWYDYYDLRSSRPKNVSPEVMSPEILSQVPRNAELCGSKFYHAQKGIQWFRPVTSSPRYSSPLKEPGSPPKTIEFAPCTSGSCLSTSVNTLTFFCLCLLEV